MKTKADWFDLVGVLLTLAIIVAAAVHGWQKWHDHKERIADPAIGYNLFPDVSKLPNEPTDPRPSAEEDTP